MNFRFYAALIGNAERLGPLTVPLEADTVSAFRRRLLMPGTLPWDAGWTNVPYHPSWGLETPGHCKVPPLPRGAGGPSRLWPTGLTESHASPPTAGNSRPGHLLPGALSLSPKGPNGQTGAWPG